MAGGTWIDQNKVCPGVYINYSSAPASLASMGDRGVVCIAKSLNWGVTDEFITIEDPTEAFEKLGYDQMSDEMIWLRQLLVGTDRSSGASKILVWRLGADGGAKASATQAKIIPAVAATVTIGNLVCTAATPGTAGNNLSIKVTANDTKFDVSIYTSGSLGGTISGLSTVEELITAATTSEVAPLFSPVVFSGSGALSASSGDTGAALTGGAAESTDSSCSLTITAQCEGTRGNDLSVIITPDPDNTATRTIYYVQTLVSGSLVDSQTLKSDSSSVALSGLVDNDWVKFAPTGNAFAASITLAGGANGTPSATGYSDFMSASELKSWNILAYGGTDPVIKSALKSFVLRLANDEGKKVQACLWNYPSSDNECVISTNPQKFTDLSGHKLTEEEMVCWAAGSEAGASVSQSLTYAAHPDAVAVDPVLTSSQQIEALNAGQLAFISDEDGKIKILQDNNTFTSFTATKGKAFRKNRVIRTIFGLANDIYRLFAKSYIGNTNNDDFGRSLLKSEILELMIRYQGNSALQNVVADDVTVSPGADSDAVVIEVYCQPVDSIEKIYINITIS